MLIKNAQTSVNFYIDFKFFFIYTPVFDTSSVIKTQKPFVYKGFWVF